MPAACGRWPCCTKFEERWWRHLALWIVICEIVARRTSNVKRCDFWRATVSHVAFRTFVFYKNHAVSVTAIRLLECTRKGTNEWKRGISCVLQTVLKSKKMKWQHISLAKSDFRTFLKSKMRIIRRYTDLTAVLKWCLSVFVTFMMWNRNISFVLQTVLKSKKWNDNTFRVRNLIFVRF